MLVTTSSQIAGKRVTQTLGMVRGNTIRAKWFGKDILTGFRNIIGGELKEYTEMLSEAREEAMARMIAQAKDLGADAVIDARFTTSQVAQNAAEILCFGTAVKLGSAKK